MFLAHFLVAFLSKTTFLVLFRVKFSFLRDLSLFLVLFGVTFYFLSIFLSKFTFFSTFCSTFLRLLVTQNLPPLDIPQRDGGEGKGGVPFTKLGVL